MSNRTKLRIKSAIKRARQNIKRNEHKSSQRASARTAVKAVEATIISGNKEAASEAFKKAQTILDSMANKKVIHPNKASRTKSRLNKKIKAL